MAFPSCPHAAAGNMWLQDRSRQQHPQLQPGCWFWGSQALMLGTNSLCGSVIIGGHQYDSAILDLLKEGLQLLDVWEREALGKGKGI